MESFLNFIVYISGSILLFYELACLVNPVSEVATNKRFHELKKNEKGLKWDLNSDEFKSILKTKSFFMLPGYVFLFLGLFTFNWVAFLLFILIQIPLGVLFKLFRFNTMYLVLFWLNSLFTALFILFVIVNQFHLRIDLWPFIQNLY